MPAFRLLVALKTFVILLAVDTLFLRRLFAFVAVVLLLVRKTVELGFKCRQPLVFFFYRCSERLDFIALGITIAEAREGSEFVPLSL